MALTNQTFVSKIMSLLFNMLSRFAIAFLQRSKCSFNFLATVTIWHVDPYKWLYKDRMKCSHCIEALWFFKNHWFLSISYDLERVNLSPNRMNMFIFIKIKKTCSLILLGYATSRVAFCFDAASEKCVDRRKWPEWWRESGLCFVRNDRKMQNV